MLNPAKRAVIPFINAWGARIERRRFSEPPIVIGGCARSGTTMLLALLSAHPSVFAFRRELGSLTQWKEGVNGKPEPLRIDRMYRELIRRRIPPEAERWCEKSPANVRHIDKILRYYEERVRFIHIVRDPRDVLSSEHPKPSKKGGFYVSPQRWIADLQSGLAYEAHPSVLTLRYEDLVMEHESTAERIRAFLGLERAPEMEDWAENTDVKENPAWEGGVRPLYKASIGKWRKPENKERVAELLETPGLKALMERLGYGGEEGFDQDGGSSASSSSMRTGK